MDKIKEFKAVLFDVDNTLLGSNTFVFKNIKKTVDRVNQEQNQNVTKPTDEEIIQVLAKNLPFEEIFQNLFFGEINGEQIWDIILKDYRKHAPSEPYEGTPGALEAVRWLKDNGIVIGLVTNRVRMLEIRLEQAGFKKEDFICMSMPAEKAFRKPHPRAFEEALTILANIGIRPEDAIVFGDHPDDYYSAFYQNIPFVAVLQGHTKREEFIEHGITNECIIDNLGDIQSGIENILKKNRYKQSLQQTSAIDGRHALSTSKLRHYFSEYALHKHRVQAEIEHIIALSEFFHGNVVRSLSDAEKEQLRHLYKHFSAHEAYEILQYDHLSRNGIGPTEHDVKSCELWIREKLANTTMQDIIPMVHLFVTSEDISNLAYKLMLANAVNDVFIPEIHKITDRLRELAEQYIHAPLMSRTHVQPASPTTFGKMFGTYLSRFTNVLTDLKRQKCVGKINGAVGNYNSFVSAFPNLDWIEYSTELTSRLGFDVDLWTDQRGPHTDIIQIFQTIQQAGNIIRDISTDLSLYAAFGTLYFSKVETHVGSSVMPHKINPWFAEVAEGNIKKVNYIINSFTNELDVSRLQRDLSDHDFERSYGEAMGYVLVANDHLKIALGLIRPDLETARAELQNNSQVVTEAVQTVLRKHGRNDAYDLLKTAFRGKKITTQELITFVNNLDIAENIKQEIIPQLNPETYVGLAPALAQKAIAKYDQYKRQSTTTQHYNTPIQSNQHNILNSTF